MYALIYDECVIEQSLKNWWGCPLCPGEWIFFAYSKNDAVGLLPLFNNLPFAEINNLGYLDRLAGRTDKAERFTEVKR